MRNDLGGFTIIELLVVITIIVVLLALLTPAMDRAIYQAELAACGASKSAAARGMLIYAADYKRHYPTRRIVNGVLGPQPVTIQISSRTGGRVDDRPAYEGYVSLDLFLDPLAGEVDFGFDDPDNMIMTTVSRWNGFYFAGYDRMNRMGDRFSYDWSGTEYKFNVLIADHDFVAFTGPFYEGSHPDDQGVLALNVQQDAPYDPISIAVTGETGGGFTSARWSAGTPRRGRIDMNVGFDDGSVRRFDKVTHGIDPEDRDERMAQVPHDSANTNAGVWWLNLPPLGR